MKKTNDCNEGANYKGNKLWNKIRLREEEYTDDSERDAGNKGRQVAIAFFFDANVSNKAIERINDKDDADDFGYNVDNRAMPEYHANTKNK